MILRSGLLATSRDLQPGTIGINVKGRVDPADVPRLGTVARAGHAWYVLPSGRIATTGADRMVLYGDVVPEEYLAGRHFFLLRTVDALTSSQLATLEMCHQRLVESGPGRIFGFWQYAWIRARLRWDAQVKDPSVPPRTALPSWLFCSQAVAYAFWTAGIPIGKMLGWQDWTVILPLTMLQEARAVNALIASGQIDRHRRPCYYLRPVQDVAFSFTRT
jgi:hypothetical protein